MSVLDSFTPDQRDLLVSLPYRVGLWMSQSDSSGGARAQEAELRALAAIIHGFSEDVFGSEFVQYVMRETIARKSEWGGWGERLDRVPDQCGQALEILGLYLAEKEIKVYALRMMDIAEAVALAFREYEGKPSLLERLSIFCTYWRARIRMGKAVNVRSMDYFMSVSKQERLALRRISRVLGIVNGY